MRPPLLLGADLEVSCVDGRQRRYVNLDYAASTPVMAEVWAAVEAFVPWYSSVHRGSGAKSQVSTAARRRSLTPGRASGSMAPQSTAREA